MSTIRGYSQSNHYDSADNDYSAYNQNASSFLAGLSINSGNNSNNGIMGGINLSDYASIKNGSYGKLVYDWDSITKAVKSFVDNYNKTIESAGNSNTKDVLRNAAWLTKTTKSTERLLEKAGITVGADNKLELDEDALKKADIGTLKSIFTGYGSYISKVYDKAQSITTAAATAGGTYTNTGRYSDALASILPSNIDKKE